MSPIAEMNYDVLEIVVNRLISPLLPARRAARAFRLEALRKKHVLDTNYSVSGLPVLTATGKTPNLPLHTF